MKTLTVFSVTLGDVNPAEVEQLLTQEAKKIGYAELQKMAQRLREAIESEECTVVEERELTEVEFMMSTFQDEEGYVKEDIEF